MYFGDTFIEIEPYDPYEFLNENSYTSSWDMAEYNASIAEELIDSAMDELEAAGHFVFLKN